MKPQRIRVVRYSHPKKTSWCVDGLYVNGQRKRFFYATKAEAETKAQ